MNGLINPAPEEMPQEMPAETPPQGNQPAVKPSSADYKSDYMKYVNKATILIHSPETRGAVLALLNDKDPVQRTADATVMVMQRIDSAARTEGIEVQDTIKMFGANEIVKLVVEFGEAAGKFKMDKDLTELAFSVAVQDYIKGEVAAKRINAQKLKMQMDIDIRKMPDKQRSEMIAAQKRIQMTARRYNQGRG